MGQETEPRRCEVVGVRECGRPPPPAGGRGRRGRQGEQEGTGGVCVCARAHVCAQGSWGARWMSPPGITAHLTPETALNQEGKALPGLAEVQPVRCLCLVGWAASQEGVGLG